MKRAFTLIELMIVVAIIAIIAAIAIPNLLRSRMAANESTAIGACKTYAEAQDIYRRTDYNSNGILEYAATLGSLFTATNLTFGDLALIDEAFARAEGDVTNSIPKAGYCFQIQQSQGVSAPGGTRSYWASRTNRTGTLVSAMMLGYGLSAVPAQYDLSGRNSFQINNTGTVYQMDRGAASTSHYTEYNPISGWIMAE